MFLIVFQPYPSYILSLNARRHKRIEKAVSEISIARLKHVGTQGGNE